MRLGKKNDNLSVLCRVPIGHKKMFSPAGEKGLAEEWAEAVWAASRSPPP